METEKLIVAIDLGSSHIVGVVGKKENDKIKIIAVEREPSDGAIRRGCIANIEEAASKVKKLVTKLENKLSARIDCAYVGLGGQSVRSIRHTASRHL
ncbi:MAG: cell division protein FtsA, partial [Bacteroidales bacterium]